MAPLLTLIIKSEPNLELVSSGPLSIVRFRYVPPALRDNPSALDAFNKELALAIQRRGKAFLTSTFFRGKEALRACIVNYMTGAGDILTMVEEVIDAGDDILSL
jgi:glutamate/tyrosine decarboxylase-like PLP-dependent enzyme